MREILQQKSFEEKRRAEFARDYRARLTRSPLSALSGLLRLNVLDEEDLSKASSVPGYYYKVRNWAHANLGAGDYVYGIDEGVRG